MNICLEQFTNSVFFEKNKKRKIADVFACFFMALILYLFSPFLRPFLNGIVFGERVKTQKKSNQWKVCSKRKKNLVFWFFCCSFFSTFLLLNQNSFFLRATLQIYSTSHILSYLRTSFARSQKIQGVWTTKLNKHQTSKKRIPDKRFDLVWLFGDCNRPKAQIAIS